jgi:ribosomal protein S18 acetylase RimI-like enzyme
VPRIHDPAEIRTVLETDRTWTAYALGDLAPGYFEDSAWYRAPGGAPALALLYQAFATPVLFTLGPPEAVRTLLDEIGDQPSMYLSIRPDILPLIKARYDVHNEMPTWRMLLDRTEFRPAPASGAEPLGPADLEVLQRLYADGEAAGEAPDFFSASMLEQGVFFGIAEGDELVAAAGTHLVVPAEGVAAIGNVYTRRDRRGRGLAARVTGAVASELLGMKLRTVVLNVHQRNGSAARVYERLGFLRYCDFYEGMAVAR